MIADARSTSRSQRIQQGNGWLISFSTHFLGTTLRGTSCETAIAATERSLVKRLIGSIRRECLNHVIVLRESGLRRILKPVLRILRAVAHPSIPRQRCSHPSPHPTARTGSSCALPQVGGFTTDTSDGRPERFHPLVNAEAARRVFPCNHEGENARHAIWLEIQSSRICSQLEDHSVFFRTTELLVETPSRASSFDEGQPFCKA
jgi:hypothetical protein